MTECPRCHAPIEPDARFCPDCGLPLEGAAPQPAPLEDVLLTAPAPLPGPGSAGAEEPQAPRGPSGTPWERRAEIGLAGALVETTMQVLGKPTAFFRAMSPTGGLGGPLLYGLIIGYVGFLAASVYDAIFRSLVGGSLGPFAGNEELEKFMPTFDGWGSVAVQAVVGPLVLIFVLFFAAFVTHVMLTLLGGANRDFEATFRVTAYTQATQIFGLIPFCGGLVATVYAIVVSIIGLSEVHGISRGKAAAAVLLPLVLCCLCAAGLAGVALWAVGSALSGR
jgi:hypothetical protein